MSTHTFFASAARHLETLLAEHRESCAALYLADVINERQPEIELDGISAAGADPNGLTVAGGNITVKNCIVGSHNEIGIYVASVGAGLIVSNNCVFGNSFANVYDGTVAMTSDEINSLASGDYVRLENPDGRRSNRVRVRVTERIRPDSIFIVHGFGHTDARQRLARGVGADDAALMHNVKIDPVMGGTGMRASFVTLIKSGGVS